MRPALATPFAGEEQIFSASRRARLSYSIHDDLDAVRAQSFSLFFESVPMALFKSTLVPWSKEELRKQPSQTTGSGLDRQIAIGSVAAMPGTGGVNPTPALARQRCRSSTYRRRRHLFARSSAGKSWLKYKDSRFRSGKNTPVTCPVRAFSRPPGYLSWQPEMKHPVFGSRRDSFSLLTS